MAFIKLERRTWKTLDALDTFGRYWRKSEELITQDADIEQLLNQPDWHPETDSEHGEYCAAIADVRRFHDHDMKRSLRYTCSALLYSIVEVELNRFVRNLDGKKVKPQSKQNGGKESFLEAFGRHLKTHCLDVSIFPEYSFVLELQAVRHYIIHCWGEMEHVKPTSQKKRLLDMSDFKGAGLVCLQKGEIHIESHFLHQRLCDSWNLFLRLFDWANWTVDKAWLAKLMDRTAHPPGSEH